MEQAVGEKRVNGRTILLSISLIRGIAGPGLNSSLGLFFPAVAAAFGVGVGALSWTVGIAAVAGMFFLPFAERLYADLGVRSSAFVGILLLSLSFLLNGVAKDLFALCLFAIPFGMGTVLIVNLLGPLVFGAGETMQIGGALGWMMALSGVVAMVVQPALTFAISFAGWRFGYFIGGGVALYLLLFCLLALPKTAPAPQRVTVQSYSDTGTWRVFVPLFVLLFVISAFNAFHQHFAVLGRAAGFDAGGVGFALSLSMGGVAVGGLLLGWVTHQFNAVICGYTTLGIGAVSIVLFLIASENSIVFSLAALLHGVASAAIGITVQSLARERCGEDYGRVLAKLLTAIPLATVTATPVFGMVFDQTGSYTSVLWGILCALALGVGCLVWLTSVGQRKSARQ